jgi:hypothetical protein
LKEGDATFILFPDELDPLLFACPSTGNSVVEELGESNGELGLYPGCPTPINQIVSGDLSG